MTEFTRPQATTEEKNQENKPVYISPKKLTTDQRILLNNLFAKHNGNKKAVERESGLHYTTIDRYFNKKFNDGNRSDKGLCRKLRKLSKKEQEHIKQVFEYLLLSDCQGKVRLAIEKTQMNTGHKIPARVAYQWAGFFKAVHKGKHYPKKLLLNNVMHVRRDQYTEFPEFNDCVYADEWKVDEYGVWVHSRNAKFEKTRGVVYIIAFQDAHSRYAKLTYTIDSVTTADTIKAAMNWVKEFGRPKKFVLENAKTWTQHQFRQFMLGLYDDNEYGVELWEPDPLYTYEKTNNDIQRTIPGDPKGKGTIERLFRIIKDEFCAYSPGYSPNAEESRRPELNSPNPGVHRTYEELVKHLDLFMQYDFLDRQRTCFHHPGYSAAHQINKERPKTIREVFNNSYSTYNKVEVDELRLAYLYAEKYKRKLTGMQFDFTYPTTHVNMSFVPDDISKIYAYMDQEVVLLINQYDINKGWLFDLHGKLITGCCNSMANNVVSKEQANVQGKKKNELMRLTKKQAEAAEEYAEAKNIHKFAYEKTLPEAVEVEEVRSQKSVVSSHPELVEGSSEVFEDDSILELKINN